MRGPSCRSWAAALAVGLLSAATSAAPAQSKEELKELKTRIEELGRTLSAAEESKADAADQLRETEKAISDSNRRLHELARERDGLRRDLDALQGEAGELERHIAQQQARLARILHRNYVAGTADSLRLLLSGSDPNQFARDLYFLQRLSRAQAALIAQLQSDLKKKRELGERVRSKAAELEATDAEQRSARASLLDQQNRKKVVLARISKSITAQRREIETLRRNERRLTRLIEGLSRIVTKPSGKPDEPEPKTPARRGTPVRSVPDASLAGESFAKLKGRLRLPVRGELVTRFGTPRAESGGASKGLFIRAETGGEVRAIASGRVVFADWLRGFGNLIILDHGSGYLTVYGNNEALLRELGQAVKAGDAIASVGASGGSPETGLYFELRHEGRAIDPMKWVTLR